MKIIIILAAVFNIASAGFITPKVHPVPLEDASYSENDIEERITNGHPAAVDQFPYQVGLSLKFESPNRSWCGGSLIGATWVLTAAHCLDGVQSVTVNLGSTDRTSPKVSYTVNQSSIIEHPNYFPIYSTNDIALIKIPPVKFSSSIQTVRLPSISANYPTYSGSYAIASGWGRTSDTSSVVDHLNYARLQVIDNSACAEYYGTRVVTLGTICVATPGGVSTCLGDSGGPLVLENDHLLIGISSFVPSAGCTNGIPAGFTRVTRFLDWIKSETGISY